MPYIKPIATDDATVAELRPDDNSPSKKCSRGPRLSWLQKLQHLDARATARATEQRLEEFKQLFAFRECHGIVTQLGYGPSTWTAFRGRLDLERVARHLLGGHVPGLRPQWYGTRSFATSRYFVLDVDSDPTPMKRVARYHDVDSLDPDKLETLLWAERAKEVRTPRKPTFKLRCKLVETTLRRLGINPKNPRKVLVLRTPSGGRHYYVFFKELYRLDQYKSLLEEAGLRFRPGQVEFFPSEKQALRLPFGHVPKGNQSAGTWIQFIDDYRNGRIRKYTLRRLYKALDKSRSRASINPQIRPSLVPSRPSTVASAGLPARQPTTPSLEIERYEKLVFWKPSTESEVSELMQLGIRVEGTRTSVLKHLAAHLIWIKGGSKEEAAQELTRWALHRRHESKDVRQDLAEGTDRVAKHIQRMCEWYEKNRMPFRRPRASQPIVNAKFASQELAVLRTYLSLLPVEQRSAEAVFYLHFLNFAKQCGRPSQDGSGWEAAPAINAVVKKWPGCHHAKYKSRIELACQSGSLRLLKNKWQNPNGKGRARTYLIAVPVVSQAKCEYDYDAALSLLQSEAFDAPGEEITCLPSLNASEPIPYEQHADQANGSFDQTSRVLPTTLCTASTGSSLDSSPRECTSQPDATPGLPRAADDALPNNDCPEELAAECRDRIDAAIDRLFSPSDAEPFRRNKHNSDWLSRRFRQDTESRQSTIRLSTSAQLAIGPPIDPVRLIDQVGRSDPLFAAHSRNHTAVPRRAHILAS